MPILHGPDGQRLNLTPEGGWVLIPHAYHYPPGGDPTKSPEANRADVPVTADGRALSVGDRVFVRGPFGGFGTVEGFCVTDWNVRVLLDRHHERIVVFNRSDVDPYHPMR